MEADTNEEREFFRATTRKFIESEVPLSTVRKLADTPLGFDPDWWKRAAELGWTSMLVPEELGGGSLGGGLSDLVIVAEEMGRLNTPGPLVPSNVVAAAISSAGSDSQREALLPGILSGGAQVAWAVIEPIGVWSADLLGLELRRCDGGFLLRGCKEPVESALGAQHFLVTARGEQGLTQVLVPASTAGITCTPLQSLDVVRRFASVQFDDVEVPESALVGELGQASADVERSLQIALALQCAESVGAASALFESTLEYMFDRFSFGRPLASYQALKHRFADMKMWLEGSRAISVAAAAAIEERRMDAAELCSAAKAYVGEHTINILQECIQMHGGMGVTWEHVAHLYLRRVTQNRSLYGTPAEHLERVAAMLGMGAAGGSA